MKRKDLKGYEKEQKRYKNYSNAAEDKLIWAERHRHVFNENQFEKNYNENIAAKKNEKKRVRDEETKARAHLLYGHPWDPHGEHWNHYAHTSKSTIRTPQDNLIDPEDPDSSAELDYLLQEENRKVRNPSKSRYQPDKPPSDKGYVIGRRKYQPRTTKTEVKNYSHEQAAFIGPNPERLDPDHYRDFAQMKRTMKTGH